MRAGQEATGTAERPSREELVKQAIVLIGHLVRQAADHTPAFELRDLLGLPRPHAGMPHDNEDLRQRLEEIKGALSQEPQPVDAGNLSD